MGSREDEVGRKSRDVEPAEETQIALGRAAARLGRACDGWRPITCHAGRLNTRRVGVPRSRRDRTCSKLLGASSLVSQIAITGSCATTDRGKRSSPAFGFVRLPDPVVEVR